MYGRNLDQNIWLARVSTSNNPIRHSEKSLQIMHNKFNERV